MRTEEGWTNALLRVCCTRPRPLRSSGENRNSDREGGAQQVPIASVLADRSGDLGTFLEPTRRSVVVEDRIAGRAQGEWSDGPVIVGRTMGPLTCGPESEVLGILKIKGCERRSSSRIDERSLDHRRLLQPIFPERAQSLRSGQVDRFRLRRSSPSATGPSLRRFLPASIRGASTISARRTPRCRHG